MQQFQTEHDSSSAVLDKLRHAAMIGLPMHPMSFGMHLRLMLHYYGTASALPKSREALQRISGAMSRSQRSSLLKLTERMWTPRSGGLVPASPRLRLSPHLGEDASASAEVVELSSAPQFEAGDGSDEEDADRDGALEETGS